MANEIPWVATAGLTLYAQIFNSVGQFWNTNSAAFENYATANIADYDIALTEQGVASGVYFGTFPPAIANGGYTCIVRSRAGGAPAESDFALGTIDIQWNSTTGATVPLTSVILNPAGLDPVVVEAGLNARQAISVIVATTGGKVSGAGTGTETFRNAVADNANRVVATVDSSGNRTAITYNLPS
jgi:hypothetical protein